MNRAGKSSEKFVKDLTGEKMKIIVTVILALWICLPAFSRDLFSDATKTCIKVEINKLVPNLELEDVLCFAGNPDNFDYMIFITEQGRVVDRMFVSVKDGNVENANLQFTGMGPQTIDLSNCL